MSTEEWRYGWRFLNAAGGTNPTDKEREHYSVLPRPDQRWSDWTEHDNPALPDGKDCGPGRLHVMNSADARYAPVGWYPWYCRWRQEDEIGCSTEKTSVRRYQLRRVRPTVWWRTIRLGWWRGADLSDAGLSGADLGRADLSYANLRGADLSRANLSGANLRGADLSGANLRRADLRRANLSGADLGGADLRGADLSCANLRRANLSGADLSGADLSYTDLGGADLGYANLSGADLSCAIGYTPLQ